MAVGGQKEELLDSECGSGELLTELQMQKRDRYGHWTDRLCDQLKDTLPRINIQPCSRGTWRRVYKQIR